MNIIWSFIDEDTVINIKLEYNMFLGSKKIFANGLELSRVRSFKRTKSISFNFNEKGYKIEMTPEEFGYRGELITPDGEKIYCETKPSRGNTPLWITPFVIINMSIPILSVEAVTPWIIGVGTCYIAARCSKKKEWGLVKRLVIVAAISIIAWAMYYLFYTLAKDHGVGNLLPF